jgi:hypothetical protein
MMENDEQIDELIDPVVQAFKVRARNAIDEATASIRNILRVKYDAPKECLPGLPSPRLQLRWEQTEYDGNVCHYEMVFPLQEWDIRNDAKTGHAVVELGRTKSSGDRNWSSGGASELTPFRDGAHAKWDSSLFGDIPIYAITPYGRAVLVEREAERAA